jgi:hypothetical protein
VTIFDSSMSKQSLVRQGNLALTGMRQGCQWILFTVSVMSFRLISYECLHNSSQSLGFGRKYVKMKGLGVSYGVFYIYIMNIISIRETSEKNKSGIPLTA